MSAGFILFAQNIKIVAGLLQLAVAIWLFVRPPRTTLNLTFALAYGANGVAYAIFNLALPGQRPAGSLALEGWGALNWVATLAMLAFGAQLLRSVRNRKPALWIALSVALVYLISSWIEASERGIDLIAFGGTVIYVATAFCLALLPSLFSQNSGLPSPWAAFLGSALAINSVDHLGAELIRPSPVSSTRTVSQLAAIGIVLALWLWNTRAPHGKGRLIWLVVFCMLTPFFAGILVRLTVHSYAAVQQSGFIGVGRVASSGLLAYAMLVHGLFSSPGPREVAA